MWHIKYIYCYYISIVIVIVIRVIKNIQNVNMRKCKNFPFNGYVTLSRKNNINYNNNN